MGLLAKLQELGCQLKLVQTVGRPTAKTPAKVSTKSVTIKELMTELRSENVKLLAESPIELTIEFGKIFESAGIKIPNHGWTIEKFIEVFQSKYETTDKNEVKKTVLTWLSENKVSSEELVRDALAKDQALDAYEEYVFKKMDGRNQARQGRVAEIAKELDKLKKEQIRLEREMQMELDNTSKWQNRKKSYEQNISRAVDLLTNHTQ
ncbi:MAG: hypothetical protein ABFD91_18000 [Anaerohalosphaeraceae bacterium]